MTARETDLCDRIREWSERQGFEVYPEVSGWDLVLVTAEPRTLDARGRALNVMPGEQVGIHAKLRANCEVLCQAYPNADPEFVNWTHGPTFPMVAVPVAGNGFSFVAARLGIGVITSPDERGPRIDTLPRRAQSKPLHLPPVASRAIVAGAPSPRQLSVWRVKALRFMAGVRATSDQRFTVTTLKAYGLSASWVERFGVAVDWTSEIRRGKAVRVRVYRLTDKAEQLPDWGYKDVAAELWAADRKAQEPAA